MSQANAIRCDCKTYLQDDWGDQTLDSGGLESLLLAFLQCQWALDDVLADIILLAEIEELADVASALGSETTWNVDVGQSGNLLLTLADDDQGEGRQVLVNDASAD